MRRFVEERKIMTSEPRAQQHGHGQRSGTADPEPAMTRQISGHRRNRLDDALPDGARRLAHAIGHDAHRPRDSLQGPFRCADDSVSHLRQENACGSQNHQQKIQKTYNK